MTIELDEKEATVIRGALVFYLSLYKTYVQEGHFVDDADLTTLIESAKSTADHERDVNRVLVKLLP